MDNNTNELNVNAIPGVEKIDNSKAEKLKGGDFRADVLKLAEDDSTYRSILGDVKGGYADGHITDRTTDLIIENTDGEDAVYNITFRATGDGSVVGRQTRRSGEWLNIRELGLTPGEGRRLGIEIQEGSAPA